MTVFLVVFLFVLDSPYKKAQFQQNQANNAVFFSKPGCLLSSPTSNIHFIITHVLPEDDDETIEDVEAVADVAEHSVGEDLEGHLGPKQYAEHDVTVLQDHR